MVTAGADGCIALLVGASFPPPLFHAKPPDARRETQRNALARQYAAAEARAHSMRRRWRLVAVAALVALTVELRHPHALSAWCGAQVWPRAAAAWHWVRNDMPRLIGYTWLGCDEQLTKHVNHNYCVFTKIGGQI
jgi:hypothetical protein